MDTIKIDDGNGNAVYIRARKLGYGLRQRITSEALRACSPDGALVVPDMFMVQLFTLKHYITRWEGPDFPPYVNGEQASIEMLDDLDPEFGDAIVRKINEVNGGEVVEKKEPTTASGDAGSVGDAAPSVDDTPPT